MAQSAELARTRNNDTTIAFRDILPKPTPFNVSFFGLWMLGMFVMLLAPALVPVDEASLNIHHEKMMEAKGVDVYDAVEQLRFAQEGLYRAKVWPWQWNAENTRLYDNEKHNVQQARIYLDGLLAQQYAIQKEGKQAVGLWSEFGLQEMRDKFWENINWGAGIAKRQTYYQAFFSMFSMMGGRRDENMLGVILQWVMRILFNFTFGLMMACFSFIISVPSMIDSYGASFMSSFAFMMLAVLGAASVVLTILTCMWGTVAGAGYVAVTQAIKHQRLQDGRPGRQNFIRGAPRGGYGRRPHYN